MRYTTTTSGFETPLRRLGAVVCLLLSMLFMSSTIIGTALPPVSTVAHAKEDPNDIMDKGLADYKGEKNEKSFDDMMKRAFKETDRNNFGFVIRRVFGIGTYMNETPNGYSAAKKKPKDGKNCHVNDPYAGTPLYHNCDVPNMMTEFVQTLTSVLVPSGVKGGEVVSAEVPFGLGVPSVLPGNKEVPVDPSKRMVKYTALELYGYSPHYTRYLGEWDNIKVMTSARMMANFGAMDSFKATGNAIFQGVKGGASGAAAGTWSGIKSGNIFKAVGGFFGGWAEGATTGTLNAILDTSDLNVFERTAWYRVGYGETLYNAREVTQIEFAWLVSNQFADLFGGAAEKAQVPDTILATKNGIPALKKNISKCEITEADGTKTIEKSATPEGVSKEDCESRAKESPGAKATWTVDGTAKGETLAEWETRNSALLSEANQYGMTCKLDTSAKDVDTAFEDYNECWKKAWPKMAEAAQQFKQVLNDDTFFNKIFSFANIFAKLIQPKRNFNAPWNRFVCLDANGKDMYDNKGEIVFLYSADKKLNPQCKSPRPPIQNGWYGNGYVGEQPPVDTRYELISHYTPLDVVLNPVKVYGNSSIVSDGFFKMTKVTTQLTIAVIDLSMSPLADTLGLKDTVVTVVESLRESIFFPLAVLVIAFSAVWIFFTTVRQRAFRKGFTDILLIIFTFVLGTLLMYNPGAVIDTADEIPTAVEGTIAGAILEAAPESDEMCSATQMNSSEGFNARANIRTMECEIWRNFVFYPWVQGQWGTSYNNLYANGTPGKTTLNNTNGDLVGDAKVVMGGGVTVNNWALYQLDVTSSGTSTTADKYSRDGGTPRDFYRIVDAQAGPNNGNGTDPQYLQTWAGKNGAYRASVAALSFPVAVVGLVTFFTMGVTKIILSLMFVIMVLIAPFMFLVGLHPTFGRRKLLQYGGTMATYIVQRIVIVILMALMLLFLTMTTSQMDSYLLAALLTIVLCVGFRNKKNSLLNYFAVSVGNATGGLIGNKSGDPTSTVWNTMPKSIKNFGQEARSVTTSTIGGAVTGFAMGGTKQARDSIRHSTANARMRLRTTQRRAGNLGDFTKLRTASEAGRHSKQVRELTKTYQKEKNTTGKTGDLYNKLNIMAQERGEDVKKNPVRINFNDDRSKEIVERIRALDAESTIAEKNLHGETDAKGRPVVLKVPKAEKVVDENGEMKKRHIKKMEKQTDENFQQNEQFYAKKKNIAIEKQRLMCELYARNSRNLEYSSYRESMMESGIKMEFEQYDPKTGEIETVEEIVPVEIPELTLLDQMKKELEYARHDFVDATDEAKEALERRRAIEEKKDRG